MFADDTKILRKKSSKEDEGLLLHALNVLANWCKEWKLVLNPLKCTSVSLSLGPPPHHTYKISSEYVSSRNTQKDLGIIISLIYLGQNIL